TETEKLLSACAIRVPAFPRGWSNNFSSHSFQPKRKAPEWGSRFPAASSKRTAGHFREKIVTMGAPVLWFACPKHRRTNPRRLSSVLGGDAEPKNNGKCDQSGVKYNTSGRPLTLRIGSVEAPAPRKWPSFRDETKVSWRSIDQHDNS